MKNAPPIPQTLVQQIIAMKVGEHREFRDNPAHSVRALLSRNKANPKLRDRQYVTRLIAGDKDHAQVWRLK